MSGWQLAIIHEDGNHRFVTVPDMDTLEQEVTDEVASDFSGVLSFTITRLP